MQQHELKQTHYIPDRKLAFAAAIVRILKQHSNCLLNDSQHSPGTCLTLQFITTGLHVIVLKFTSVTKLAFQYVPQPDNIADTKGKNKQCSSMINASHGIYNI